jgi:SAM-dependent methyltransferase
VYALRLCPACGLVFADPLASPGPGWYQLAAGAWIAEPSGDPSKNWRVGWLRGLFPSGGRGLSLVDIGCGDGFFLAGAKGEGFYAWGIDFDSERTAAAASRGLGTVFTGTPEEFMAAHPGRAFDVATAFQALEHVDDPAAVLRGAAALLKPGGLLLADVPNADRAFGGTLAIIDYPPHHLTRWTEQALRAVFARAGFEVLRADSIMQLGNFYDHIFSTITLNLAALFKKLRYGGSMAELRLTPMAKAAGAAPAADTGAARRARLVAAVRRLYYAVFWLPLLPAAAVFVLYCRLAGKGMFTAITARKKAA